MSKNIEVTRRHAVLSVVHELLHVIPLPLAVIDVLRSRQARQVAWTYDTLRSNVCCVQERLQQSCYYVEVVIHSDTRIVFACRLKSSLLTGGRDIHMIFCAYETNRETSSPYAPLLQHCCIICTHGQRCSSGTYSGTATRVRMPSMRCCNIDDQLVQMPGFYPNSVCTAVLL